MMRMRTIRASEIGAFLYCQRAWKYRQQGLEPSNQAELAAGNGRQVVVAGLMRGLAMLLLLASLIIITVYLTRQLIH